MTGLASVRYHPGTSLAVHKPLTPATAKQIPIQQTNETQRILAFLLPQEKGFRLRDKDSAKIPASADFSFAR